MTKNEEKMRRGPLTEQSKFVNGDRARAKLLEAAERIASQSELLSRHAEKAH